MLSIRKYQEDDCDDLWALFYNTVRFINIKDYSKSQVDAWASKDIKRAAWSSILAKNQPFIAIVDGMVAGYADLQNDGLIDHFYCHHDYQGKGVGSALMQHIFDESTAKRLSKLYAHVSVTAKPFFESFGFKVVTEQEVSVRGEKLTNYLMEKAHK
ncbi:Acetyltransferase, GNAT family [Shewanella psychrophila]|uniref:Acetyltransferase, GNAT family n=1 Tax=Shewanella psychrophila TaxID=225848 RepID=A0A1S6HJF7_9GAMM|nr:GNAT family N-acetyltransferase [Shewanella psychrophila]AQS35666.1 Acetyltransferase, GNAT family [Shewanella psychrophila]